MSLLYPLGLLGLIAVPILILIYIIKNKYTEQVVPATYLWTLSEKFLKRKNPLSMINGLISLILQILAVVFISFAIAQPVFTLPDAAFDYCFILDGSASMHMERGEGNRFDAGKGEIRSIIESSADGSVYTLVYVGEATDIVYEEISDKQRALSRLDELEGSYSASRVEDALEVAQDYFNRTPAVKIVLVTDKAYEKTGNIQLINLADREVNYAVSDVSAAMAAGKIVVTGNATAYGGDATLELALYLDEGEEPSSTLSLPVTAGQTVPFTFESTSLDYRSMRVAIANEDALPEDNESIIFNVRYDSAFTTLLVSERPFFLQSVLTALGNAQVDVLAPDAYDGRTGYGLYIFDCYTPATLPSDGAVWFFNPGENTERSGFSFQEKVNINGSGKLEYNASSSSRVRNLLKGVTKSDVYLSEYVKCGFYRSFTPLLTYEEVPVLFVGANSYGNREVVFAFDLHNSNLPVSVDFTLLVNNLIEYTFPAVVDGSTYACGDIVDINVLAGCESIRVDSPGGKVAYLPTSDTVAQYTLTEVGVYTVTVMVNGSSRQVRLFSAMPLSERATAVTEQSYVILGEPMPNTRDGVYDDLIYLFIILGILFLADWAVYCYEQYQLR